jgi:8-oxo-dGTP pyrophosphatase MutT (NUDIX family)
MGWDWDEVRRALASRPHEEVAEAVKSRAAVSLVFRDPGPGATVPELLFIRRAEHPLDPWSGQMAFPGGRREPQDGSMLETAIRETREEVGLDLARDAELLGPLDEVRAMARLRPMNLVIAPFAFRLRGGPEAQALHEVRSVHWLPLERLVHPGSRAVHDYAHEGATLKFPCLRLEDIVIWGLTYRMFEALAERLAACIAGTVQLAGVREDERS